jgi:hypothetical protein
MIYTLPDGTTEIDVPDYTLLGPNPEIAHPDLRGRNSKDSQSHMGAVHRINLDVPSADQNHTLNPGVDPQVLDEMRRDYRAHIGMPSMSEQERKTRGDRSNINNSFPRS